MYFFGFLINKNTLSTYLKLGLSLNVSWHILKSASNMLIIHLQLLENRITYKSVLVKL